MVEDGIHSSSKLGPTIVQPIIVLDQKAIDLVAKKPLAVSALIS
jgi:hypothetical protein